MSQPSRLPPAVLGALGLLGALAVSSCALTDGRRHCADISLRHARAIRQELAAIPAAPEFAPIAPALERIGTHAEAVEEWQGIAQDDHGKPERPLKLGSREEPLERMKYQGAAKAKNAIMGLLPRISGSGGGMGFLGTLLGGGGLAGLAGIGKLLFERRRLKRERDDSRGAADDLEGALEEVKQEAANGGLRKKRFGEIMENRTAARRHHARRKLEAAEAS